MSILSHFDGTSKQAAALDTSAAFLLEAIKAANLGFTNPTVRCQQIAQIVCNRAPVVDYVVRAACDAIEASAAEPYIKTAEIARIYRAQGLDGNTADRRTVTDAESDTSSTLDESSSAYTTSFSPVEPHSSAPLEGEPQRVYVDVEAARWSYALGLNEAYRQYVTARRYAENNKVHIDTLAAAVPHCQSDFYKHLSLKDIDAGISPFFRERHGKWLYFRAEKHMAARLAERLLEQGLHGVLDGRKPGIRKRQLPLDYTHADVWAAWLDSKRSKRISRQTETQLWNVTEKTVRLWDKASGIQAQRNYGQTADMRDERVPADREDYKVATINGVTVAMWQRANTYHVKQVFYEHPHKGQARKVRKAISAVLSTEQPADNLAAAHPFRIHNFAGGDDPLQAWKDYTAALRNKPFAQVTDYLYRGQRQQARGIHRPAIWELMTRRPGQEYPRTTSGQYVRVNS